MGAAAYRRGSAVIARQADMDARVAVARADRQALRDENERLRSRVSELEHLLARARRCLAAERAAREKRVAELKADVAGGDSAISHLCRIAFPGDTV